MITITTTPIGRIPPEISSRTARRNGRHPALSPKLRDAEQRLEWMDGQSIDVQVTGGWLDSFGYELPAQEGAAWSRFLNAFMMTGTEEIDRLTPLATVPLQNGKLASEVQEEAMNAGFAGVMIGTQPHGNAGNLDDADLDPFWQAASSLALEGARRVSQVCAPDVVGAKIAAFFFGAPRGKAHDDLE